MKKLLFFILTLSVVACSVTKQTGSSTGGYKPLKTFKGDTLSYYKTNFIENKSQYIDKDMSVLLNDLEIPVLSYIQGHDSKNPANCDNIIISNENKGKTDRIIDLKNEKLYLLTVKFPPPILYRSLSSYRLEHGAAITKDQYQYFSQFKITDIILSAYPH